MAEEIPAGGRVRVMVVDDHPLFREGVGHLMREAGYLVTEVASGEEALSQASSTRPHLVIMDVLMPGMSGIEATERMRSRDPAVRVVVLSVADSPETIRAALKAGAASYLTKAATSRRTLLDAVRRTMVGERVLVPPGLMNALVQGPAALTSSPVGQLSLREREIAALAARGTSSSSIANRLGLSVRTVDNHLARIFRKLGIANRAQLARVAIDSRIDRYPWTGQTCTIMVVDIAAFSAPVRDDQDRMFIRKAMYKLLATAFEESGLPWSACHREDRGDGVLIAVPPNVPPGSLVDPLLSVLAAGLRRHNRLASEPTRIRLRIALHVGAVHADSNGIMGTAVVHVFRLLEADAFRQRLAENGRDMGVIVSGYFYETVLRHRGRMDPAVFERADVQVKETSTTAWMLLEEPHHDTDTTTANPMTKGHP